MSKRLIPAFAAFAAATIFATPLAAQTTASTGSVMVIPLVASTSSYTTEVFVRNPAFPFNAAITINVLFYEAQSSSVPGQRTCAQLVVQPQQTIRFTLATQCTLGPGNHHGLLVLENAAVEKTSFFAAYSRSQTPGGNGFSVEGFPIGNFSGQSAGVIGVRRLAAAPIYQTNCFIAALGEAIDYRIGLRDGPSGNTIGTDLSGSLGPWQMRRYLDIYTVLGAPPGDYVNTRVVFQKDGASAIVGDPAFVAFCTVQESTFFGADFRIAKSASALNLREFRTACYGQTTCGTLDGTVSIVNETTKNIYYVFLTQPDFVKCELVGARTNELEMRFRSPGDVFASTVWPSAPPFSSGGNDLTSAYVFTGERTNNFGFTNRWYIEVGPREGLPGGTVFPIPYGITCLAGNGISFPWFRASTTDNF